MSLNRFLIQRWNTMTTVHKLLEPYSVKTQHWIVSTGIDLYERSKTILHESHDTSQYASHGILLDKESESIHTQSHTPQHYIDEIEHLRRQLEETRTYYTQFVHDEYTRGRQEEQSRHQPLQEQLQQDIHMLQEELSRTRRENMENREKGYKEGLDESQRKLQELTQTLASLKEERDTLHETHQTLSQKLITSRQEIASHLHEQHETELTRLRTEIDHEKQEKREILGMREQMIEKQTALLQHQYTTQVEQMQATIQGMESQIQRYQELYEATGKGIEYEKLVVSRMEEYNHQYLGNQWHIQHVGQLKGGGKGDIQLVHRELGVRVILDLKNKNEVGKLDIQKFIKDIETTENQCDIGMLIARGRIFTKRLYHVEQPKDKLHMYISNFKTDQIGFLFTSLNMACEKWRTHQKDMNMDEYRQHLFSLFLFFRKQHDMCLREVDKMKAQMTEIGDKYYKCFNTTIELDMDANKKQTSSTGNTATTNTTNTIQPLLVVDTSQNSTSMPTPTHPEVINDLNTAQMSLHTLETTCHQVVGKRSKYAIVYDTQDGKKLHYFRGDSMRQKKIQSLQQKGIHPTILDV